MWARDPAKVEHMRTMKGLVRFDIPKAIHTGMKLTRIHQIFGGAPLDQGVGDMLASRGINLYSLYGR